LKAQKGIRTLHISVDKLKDETRPILKCEQGSTRLFCCLTFHLYLCCRIYFGAFFIWFTKNRISNGSCIGINEKSDEWTLLYKIFVKE